MLSNIPSTVIYIFLDGIGIGTSNKEINPLARYKTYFLSVLGGKSSFSPPGNLITTDAHMGVKGIPQSATGQTALFTGINAAKVMKRHINGFPTFSLRPYLKKHSILKKFIENNYKGTLINSYSSKYLTKIKMPRGERFMSATTMIQKGSGLPFFTIEDYLEGKCLYMDITNWFLKQQGLNINLVKPKTAGRKLVSLSKNYNLIIYEYFFTDKAGHDGSFVDAKKIISHLEGFFEGIWEEIDTENSLIIITSDHGNFEDFSYLNHTENPVATIFYGKGSEYLQKIKYIYDIPRLILKMFNINFSEKNLID
ncbi:MAG: metalloenzyme [Spirochaetia bacterium]|nr:metalloenzyme [Spirochaetia bacterium]